MAAADAAEKKAPPPPELRAMLDWLNFSTPYYAGGIADQPYAFFHRMKAAYNVYSAIQRWKGSRRGSNWLEFQRDNPDEWKIVELVVMLRKETDHG